MQRAVIVGGTLGLGTALVFGAAAIASVMFPNGGSVAMSWNGGVWDKGIAVPAPMPVPIDPNDNTGGGDKGVVVGGADGGPALQP